MEEVNNPMKFNYFYGAEADQFSFIRIPRIMLTDESFAGLSMAAKMLYGVLLDRMSMSRKNGWADEEDRIFIIYQIGEIQEDLGFSKKKAIELLSELEKFGLLEKKRRGHGLPNVLYVKSFMTDIESRGTEKGISDQGAIESRGAGTNTSDQAASLSGSTEMDTSDQENPDFRSAESVTSRSTQNGTSRSVDFGTQEVPKTVPLKNKTYKNYNIYNKSNLIISRDDEMRFDVIQTKEDSTEEDLDEEQGYAVQIDGISSAAEDEDDPDMQEYDQLIRENIRYEDLLITHPEDSDLIEGIVQLILETELCHQAYILIASNCYPAELVKSRFLKLRYGHIEYILRCLQRNTTKVKNIRKYLLAALFNAPSTMEGYYRAEVNHDMPELAIAR